MATNANVTPTADVPANSLGGMSMRYHELALQRWLNLNFVIRNGFPVPVAYTKAMDAVSQFNDIWSRPDNEFTYLLKLKDANGTPLYEPYPQSIRYPLIAIDRKSWKTRPYQNFSIHRWRHINWPAVSDSGTIVYGKPSGNTGMTLERLGEVTTSRMPMAWDFKYELNYYCNRPDHQAFFVEAVMRKLWMGGGQQPQFWMTVDYPGWGPRNVRAYLDGDIEDATPDAPEADQQVVYRTTLHITIEGFDVDLNYVVYPALWTMLVGSRPVSPDELTSAFSANSERLAVDLRVDGNNSAMEGRSPLPPSDPAVKRASKASPGSPQYAFPGGVSSGAVIGEPSAVLV